ncbi:MAG TPA: HWE histidine kinase domain-containing protein [Rhizomicrobium sp.]|nr:HWE histidine kinase domain-containing protein [Rhizomicrobium sp.]
MERAIADYLSEAPIFVRRLNGEITYWTEGARRLYGFDWSDAIGKLSHELLQTVFPAPLELINASLVSEGAWEGLLGHTRKDGVSLWTQSGWRMKDGDVVIETNTDVTQREMLSHELIHRVKNTVAIVQALARLSFSDQASYREFSRRLMALGRAHDELLRHHWEHGDLHHILQRTLESFGVLDRASIDGPSVVLKPTAVVAYSLAFHELTTNAVKHGAFSVPAGRVSVQWRLLGDQRIYLIWQERGGPPVSAPAKGGFGKRLLESVLSRELGAPVQLRFEPTGFVCELDGPIQKTPDLPAA